MRLRGAPSAGIIIVIAMLTLVLNVVSAHGVLLVYEPFAYPDGSLTGQGGALGTLNTWSSYESLRPSAGWRVHQQGEISGVMVAGGPNAFDGLVDNLATSGGYVGLPGPLDLDPPADTNTSFEIGRNMSADIALAPDVTAAFQSNTTTWVSYVSVRGWERNEEHPNLVIATDPAPDGSRGDNFGGIGAGGDGLGTGGGPTRNNRTDIYPMFYLNGQYNNVAGAIPNNAYSQAAYEVPQADALVWTEFDGNGSFGAPNIVVMKLEWDADNGKDILSVGRFHETDTLTEANFNAIIAAQPNLSSANWSEANKPDLTQSELDTITIMGLKYFVDEIRIGTTFEDVTPESLPDTSGAVLLVR